jgi:hypothetical protein
MKFITSDMQSGRLRIDRMVADGFQPTRVVAAMSLVGRDEFQC